MNVLSKIVVSEFPPENVEVLWLDPIEKALKYFANGKWQPTGTVLDDDAIKAITDKVTADAESQISGDVATMKVKVDKLINLVDENSYWLWAFVDNNNNVVYGQTVDGTIVNGITREAE